MFQPNQMEEQLINFHQIKLLMGFRDTIENKLHVSRENNHNRCVFYEKEIFTFV